MTFDDKYYLDEIYGKLNEEAKREIEALAKEQRWSIAKTTKLMSKVGLDMLMVKMEKENNGLN